MQRWKTVGQTMVEDDRGPWVNVVSAMEQLVKRDMWILELEEEKTALVSALQGMFAAHKTFSNEFNPAGKIKEVCDWGVVNDAFMKAQTLINKHKPPGEDG